MKTFVRSGAAGAGTALCFLLCSVPFLFTGCSFEEAPISQEKKDVEDGAFKVTVAAVCDDGATRLSLGDGAAHWNADDAIGFYAGSNSNAKFTLCSMSEDGRRAEFSGSLTGSVTDGTAYAYYPYDADAAGAADIPLSGYGCQVYDGDFTSLSDFSAFGDKAVLVASPQSGVTFSSGSQRCNGFTFNFLTSLLQFRLTSSEDNVVIDDIVMSAGNSIFPVSGNVDITAEEEASRLAVKDAVTDTMMKISVPNTGDNLLSLSSSAKIVGASVLPFTFSDGTTLHFYLYGTKDGVPVRYLIDKTVAAGNSFKPGYVRNISLPVTADTPSEDGHLVTITQSGDMLKAVDVVGEQVSIKSDEGQIYQWTHTGGYTAGDINYDDSGIHTVSVRVFADSTSVDVPLKNVTSVDFSKFR